MFNIKETVTLKQVWAFCSKGTYEEVKTSSMDLRTRSYLKREFIMDLSEIQKWLKDKGDKASAHTVCI